MNADVCNGDDIMIERVGTRSTHVQALRYVLLDCTADEKSSHFFSKAGKGRERREDADELAFLLKTRVFQATPVHVHGSLRYAHIARHVHAHLFA